MHKSFTTTRQLYAWLPQECKADCKKLMDDLEKGYEKITVKAYPCYDNQRLKLYRMQQRYLADKLLKVHTKIQESLENHGWISKPIGANPQIKHKKEAWA